MKIIFISGPSGSGKTTLSNQIILKIKKGIVLSTDNYYKTGLISKLFSKFIEGYFDKSMSFNFKLFKKDFNFIVKNGISIHQLYYDFEKKTIKKVMKETNNINFLIVEGIFAREIYRTFYGQNYFFLELKVNKKECMNRVIKRDTKERGKLIKKAENDFLKSWDIYYEKFKNKNIKNNPNEYIITKNTNIEKVLEILFN